MNFILENNFPLVISLVLFSISTFLYITLMNIEYIQDIIIVPSPIKDNIILKI